MFLCTKGLLPTVFNDLLLPKSHIHSYQKDKILHIILSFCLNLEFIENRQFHFLRRRDIVQIALRVFYELPRLMSL